LRINVAAKISVGNLYKIFGHSPERALELLDRGSSKEEILEKTGSVIGVADVSFDVEEGRIFVAMGLSGSGKSTLIRCVNRLIEPTSGSVQVDGEDVLAADDDRLREIRRTKMAMVFQHFALLPHKTVAENVEYGLKVRGVTSDERREKALTTLKTVGLEGWGDYYPSNLSGGMQQRVGLARALAVDTGIMLMDEAFSALDPLIRRDMQDELLELQRQFHKTILFISHDLNEALKLGDHIGIMKDGRIVQIGTPEEIVSSPANSYVADFVQDVDRGRVFTASAIMNSDEALVVGHDTVRTAMYRMRELGRDDLYVVDREHKPLGLVNDQQIAAAIRENVQDLTKVMNTDFPITTLSAPLAEIYEIFAPGIPVAVVNEKGQLEGVVNYFDVLVNLGSTSDGAAPALETAVTQ
jgi:glycine betaine/proline transport system ATP-binding protein